MGEDLYFQLKSPDHARDLFVAYKTAGKVSKQARADSYIYDGKYFTLAINQETFEVRLVPCKEWA